jgi:hypothetical protein
VLTSVESEGTCFRASVTAASEEISAPLNPGVAEVPPTGRPTPDTRAHPTARTAAAASRDNGARERPNPPARTFGCRGVIGRPSAHKLRVRRHDHEEGQSRGRHGHGAMTGTPRRQPDGRVTTPAAPAGPR